jgi:hypothetical protein
VQKSGGKYLASIVWDQDDIRLTDYFPKGQTINAEYYSYLQVQLKNILKQKRHGKYTNKVLFLHDNAPAHGHLHVRRYWPNCVSNVLITLPILRIWPDRLPHVPWTKK